ncbi:MAG: M48 family metallopeptidase [Candidatus Absconditabacteria bacterium]
MSNFKGLQTGIWENRLGSIFLLTSFPLLIFVLIIGINYFLNGSFNLAINDSLNIMYILGPIIIGWGVISFLNYESIIFSFSGAIPISRKDNMEIYNIVENLCIQNGIPTVKIGVLDDESYNAFALGRKPENARIVLSKGIITDLNKEEVEAVVGHELTHILNKDSLLMIIIVVFVGIVATVGEIILRYSFNFKGNDDKDSGKLKLAAILIGVGLFILGYIAYPLIRLALSRRREYLADAGSVELTKNPQALIGALRKISGDPFIESIKKETVAAMCIESPFEKGQNSFTNFFKNMLSTHPSIEDRIKAIESY